MIIIRYSVTDAMLYVSPVPQPQPQPYSQSFISRSLELACINFVDCSTPNYMYLLAALPLHLGSSSLNLGIYVASS